MPIRSVEEQQKLLSEGEGESGDEQHLTVTTENPLILTTPCPPPNTDPAPQLPVTHAEPPPEYTAMALPKYEEYAQYTAASGMGVPVEVQVDGRTVPATLVQEVYVACVLCITKTSQTRVFVYYSER